MNDITVRISYDSSKPGWSALVTDEETGEWVKNVFAVEIFLEATAKGANVNIFTPKGKLYAHLDGPLDVIVENPEIVTTCPYCKQKVAEAS